jgi:hypothetical protein
MANGPCKMCECYTFRSPPGDTSEKFCICRHKKSYHSFDIGTKYAFGAIAYSPSTGDIGLIGRENTQAKADKGALKACNQGDAIIVTGGYGMWLAVARAADGSCGAAASSDASTAAELQALANCKGPNPQIVKVFHSSDRR